MIVTPNVDHIILYYEDDEFRNVYDKADLVILDSRILLRMSNFLGHKIKFFIPGSDLFPFLCDESSKKGYSVFMLGGTTEESLDKAKDNFKNRFKDLNIIGSYSPENGFEKDETKNEKIIEMINLAKPDILFMGVGTPKQEKWLFKNKEKINAKLFLGIGAAIDFISGYQKRAPIIWQKLSLEWLYRLIHNPKRLFHRYVVRDSKIFVWFLKEIFKKRKSN
jgi:N-acetylglucosaminyldiphosphoundecaprenol N-acetyl-beta-D-mannosaminyltransferase